MFEKLNHWRGAMADYTLGTFIVMVHMATAERRSLAPRR